MTSENKLLQTFIVCRSIPLNKNPGLRSTGVAEGLHCIAVIIMNILALSWRRSLSYKNQSTGFYLIGISFMKKLKKDVMNAAGSLKVCISQEVGAEAIWYVWYVWWTLESSFTCGRWKLKMHLIQSIGM